MTKKKKTDRHSWLIATAILLAGVLISVLILTHPFPSTQPKAEAESNVPQEADDGTRYTVRFYSADGTILTEETAKRGGSVLPPEAEQPGHVFKGWSQQLSGICAELEVYPQFVALDGKSKNVVRGGAVYADCDGSIHVPLRMDGNVDCCGFTVEIEYDPLLLTFEAAEQSIPGLTAEADVDKGVMTLQYAGELLSAPVQLTALRFSCRTPGSWLTEMPTAVREIVTQRGVEVVYTDAVAYDTELYLLDRLS